MTVKQPSGFEKQQNKEIRMRRIIFWMYENGEGVKQDDREAAKWYRKAAEQGNADAQKALEQM